MSFAAVICSALCTIVLYETTIYRYNESLWYKYWLTSFRVKFSHPQVAITMSGSESVFRIATDTPYLALTCELWDVYCEDLGENLQRYNGAILYIHGSHTHKEKWRHIMARSHPFWGNPNWPWTLITCDINVQVLASFRVKFSSPSGAPFTNMV